MSSTSDNRAEYVPAKDQIQAGILSESRARQTVDANWDPIAAPVIDGVFLRDVKNVVYRGGVLTELFRSEWFAGEFPIGHVTHVSLLPALSTQWHCHHHQRDIIFPVRGTLRIGLYDARQDSPTLGKSCAINFNLHRPRYLHVPPGVWHCLRNIGPEEAIYVVMNDLPYDYEHPDDWTLAPDSSAIPDGIL